MIYSKDMISRNYLSVDFIDQKLKLLKGLDTEVVENLLTSGRNTDILF